MWMTFGFNKTVQLVTLWLKECSKIKMKAGFETAYIYLYTFTPSHLDKVELTENELADIIRQTANDLRLNDNESDADSDEDGKTRNDSVQAPPANPADEFNFEQYDEEEGNALGIGSIATVPNLGDLGDNVNIRTDGPDSDEEDDYIKPGDNLILVGHVESDASVLEVYVMNEEEGSLYVHHDILLPWFPLCIEWLSFDPSDPGPGNLCAIGGMDPVIQVWDLDIVDCLTPAFKLGCKPSKKKKQKRVGHKDAVLDLSWNKNFGHVLASGSVDKTVLLWDLDQGAPHTTLTYFEEKVQTLQWHPHEAQTLLSGSCDGNARASDCRTEDAVRTWLVGGEVERVAWNTLKPFCFAASTNSGQVSYIDCRQTEPLWSIKAHDSEVTGLILSQQCPGLMVTVGNDGKFKSWDISCTTPAQVTETTLSIGQALCAAACPENPFTFAIGGDNKAKNLMLHNLTNNEAAMVRFGTRQLATVAAESVMEET